jgi:carboxypeptidase C (cathepsin A)
LCLGVLLLTIVSVVLASDPVTSGYGPEKVFQQSGYITVPGFRNDNGTHLYYWFFESRQSPETAPLVFWFTGGPGCSGLTALFFENGPYQVNKDLSLSLNPYSWNSIANVLWIDQPVGTGFSWADNLSDFAKEEEQVATDLYQFLQIFLERNPKYANLPFYITGESYAGHYNSHFAAYIVRKNAESGNKKINLQGVALGNALVDPRTQYSQYANFMYDRGFLTKSELDTYNNYTYPTCKAAIDSGFWPTALGTCNAGMSGVLTMSEINAGRTINVYDVRIPCEVPPLCYDMSNIGKFLNQPSIKAALGIPSSLSWTACANGVHMALMGDWMTNFAQDLPAVMKAGARVLVYSGVEDFICNYFGGRDWVERMKWSGQGGYLAAPSKNWVVGGATAGRARAFKGLTFLEIDAAGHLAPHDQPANTLDMLSRFIFDKPFA